MKTAPISDTHNLFRPEALAALQGCDQIIHAGDIGNPDILTQLAKIADIPADLDPGIKLIITGHSHKPRIEWRGDRLYVNPGSAGPRRFKLPVTLAILDIQPDRIEPRLISLLDPPA